ncbi:hypothetical protein BpHYR1_002913 [Brachionus plicatilis]|uniref:Uncharacterized protein n=1 Tax=Brachionus plicatilis TaxID=10195 RepID=A0A3M7QYC8_BRAPC|nr:hypothetical protein BpHYR1_002913 [Brachionus plicatilis]
MFCISNAGMIIFQLFGIFRENVPLGSADLTNEFLKGKNECHCFNNEKTTITKWFCQPESSESLLTTLLRLPPFPDPKPLDVGCVEANCRLSYDFGTLKIVSLVMIALTAKCSFSSLNKNSIYVSLIFSIHLYLAYHLFLIYQHLIFYHGVDIMGG